nr:Major facilitator superfamily MFS-1 domain containing protein [Haemonchus contortus]
MVIWDNNYSYVNLPIACIVGIMYGGYSDYYGRKVPLLIGIVSVLVENAMRILIWSPSTDISLYWFYPTAVITGLMGDFFLTMSCVNAYVADRFDDKKTLSTRMIIVSIMFSLGAFIASQSTKAILNGISSTALLVIVEGLLLVTLIAGVLILSQSRPKKDLPSTEEPQEEREVESAGCLELTKLSFYSIYESLKIFVIPREGHRRLFLYLTFGANFLDQLSFGEEKSLIGTYTLLSPFNWTKDEYANYKSLRPIVQIVGMFFGLFVLKKWWKLRDTFVICMTIATLAISLFMIGLAEASWLIYASLAPGSLHGLLNPLTYTFMTCIVEQNEIGKAFAISSIAQKLAGFAQTAILQNIYIATLSWYQGFVWLVMGGICVVAVGLYGFVHVVARREKIGS